MATTDVPDLDQFRSDARAWLEANAEPLTADDHADDEGTSVWGQGSDNVAVFHNLTEDEEQARLVHKHFGVELPPRPSSGPWTLV